MEETLEDFLKKKIPFFISYSGWSVIINGVNRPIYDIFIIRDNVEFLAMRVLTNITDNEINYILKFKEASNIVSQKSCFIDKIKETGTFIDNNLYYNRHKLVTQNPLDIKGLNGNIIFKENNNVIFLRLYCFSHEYEDELWDSWAENSGLRAHKKEFFNKSNFSIDEEEVLLKEWFSNVCLYCSKNKNVYTLVINSFEFGSWFLFDIHYLNFMLFNNIYEHHYEVINMTFIKENYEVYKKKIIKKLL